MKTPWIHVSKSAPCPVCQHPDWCCIGMRWVNCMRVESGKPCHNGGWLHALDARAQPVERRPEPERPTINAAGLMLGFWKGTTDLMRRDAALKLGVSAFALHSLGACWAQPHRAWAFPMFNGARECIGIRLRAESGRKWAVTGSRQGIFIPRSEPQATAFIVEGPTDAAAALTLGLFTLGRPSCSGCIPYTQVAINRLGIKRAVIVADNDTPGIRGAKVMADELQVPCCHLLLPSKDLREFVRLGGTRELIDSLTEQLVWQQPQGSATTLSTL